MATPDDVATSSTVRLTSLSKFPPQQTPLERLTESLKQEGPFLRVPLNRYKSMVGANHRFAHDGISDVISAVDSHGGNSALDESVKLLESLVSRLAGLRKELAVRSVKEEMQAERFTSRLNHVNLASLPTFPYWKTLRMNRILVDYLLRMSYRETAIKLTETAGIQKFLDLEEYEEFDEAREVISALQNKDVERALAWCADNKSELKESESKLELDLRLQEFIELVRAGKATLAIKYAQTYLAPWLTTQWKEDVKLVMVTLVVGTQNDRCKVLFEEKQWENLVDRFKQEFHKLYGMTFDPLLYIYLQAGLCALKNPNCYNNCYNDDHREKPGPLSLESFSKLASPLLFPMRYFPKLLCYITGEVMGPSNNPVILKNGYIYSSKACRYMIDHNRNKLTCPRTGAVCRSEDCLVGILYRHENVLVYQFNHSGALLKLRLGNYRPPLFLKFFSCRFLFP